MKRAGWLLALLSLSCAGRCSGAARGDREGPREEDDPVPLDPAEYADGSTFAPARCGPREPLAGAPLQIVGQAASVPGATLVSAVLEAPPALGVLRIGDAGDVRRTDLRPNPADAPAPALAVRGSEIYAAYFGEAEKQKQTAWVVQVGEGGATPRFRAVRERDESLALGLAVTSQGPLLAWARDGGIDVQGAERQLHVAPPEGSVLEEPRLWSDQASTWLFAIARHWDTLEFDPAPANGKGPPRANFNKVPQNQWEGAGEPRSTSWLIGYRLFASAEPIATPLTPVRGHVAVYDLTADGAEMLISVLDVTASEGADAGLWRIRWNGTDPPERSSWNAHDLGTGPFSLWPGTLVYSASNGDGVLMPTDPEKRRFTSREPSLADSRVLALGSRWLLATSSELGWVSCKTALP